MGNLMTAPYSRGIVNALYDNGVGLIASAAAEPHAL
jgi:hypothetical protein